MKVQLEVRLGVVCTYCSGRGVKISVLKWEFCWGDGGWKSLGVVVVGYSR